MPRFGFTEEKKGAAVKEASLDSLTARRLYTVPVFYTAFYAHFH